MPESNVGRNKRTNEKSEYYTNAFSQRDRSLRNGVYHSRYQYSNKNSIKINGKNIWKEYLKVLRPYL